MPRQKNTKPTNIYWLFDVRPETVAVHGAQGQPFYCGKTVGPIQNRLSEHRSLARRRPDHKAYKKINECDENIRVQTVEIVPLSINWVEREQFWIRQLRLINPEATNISTGGAGSAGAIRTPEQRALLSALRKGKKHSAETRAKIGRSRAGKLKAVKKIKVRRQKWRRPRINTLELLPIFASATYSNDAYINSLTHHEKRLLRLAGSTVESRQKHRERFWYLYE